MEVLAELEEKLRKIRELKQQVEQLKTEADAEITKVKQRYAKKIQNLKGILDRLDKDVKATMKKNSSAIFRDGDVLELKCAVLYRKIRQVVRKARSVSVELLESLGYTDGIRIEKRVDWEAISKWPDEKLTAIGTERVIKEDYQYDLKTNAVLQERVNARHRRMARN